MSWFKKLFGRKDAEEDELPAEETLPVEAPLAVEESLPAEEPLAGTQPTVESAAIGAEVLAPPAGEPPPAPAVEEEPARVDPSPPEPDAPITVGVPVTPA